MHLPGAAEFPNDNPELHRGARWVCSATRGAARAVLRYTGLEGPRLALPAPPSRTRPVPDKAADGVLAGKKHSAFRLTGPLLLDLDRVVLPHRVENVPPPPAFIFEPFVPSPVRAAPTPPKAPLAALPALPLIPMPCRVIADPVLRRRVARGLRVDIALCLSVGSDAEVSRVEPNDAEVSRVEPSCVPVSHAEPSRFEVSRVEPSRFVPEPNSAERLSRPVRRRRGLATRAVTRSPLPAADEVSRAIAELEAAFASPVGAGAPCLDRADLFSIGSA